MQKNSDRYKSRLNKGEFQVILKETYDHEEPVMFSPSGISISFFCLIKDVTDSEVTIKNPVPPDLAPKVMESNEFFLFCRAYKIETPVLTQSGLNLVFKIPSEAELSRDRTDERIYYSDKDNVHILIQHPYDKATVIKRRVFDTSRGGLSFRARQLTSFIQPGRTLPELKIMVRDNLQMTRQGKIVYVKRIIDFTGESFHQVGVKFTDVHPAQEGKSTHGKT